MLTPDAAISVWFTFSCMTFVWSMRTDLSPDFYRRKFEQVMSMSSLKVDDTDLNGFYKTYVSSFFANATSINPNAKPFRGYHIQKNEPQGRNPILTKNPNLISAINAMPVDFYQDREDKESDPFFKFHEVEANMRTEENLSDLEVSMKVLTHTLSKMMSLPRNEKTHPKNREAIGSYLYGRLGRLGLVTHMQTFQATRPMFGNPDQTISSKPGANIIAILPGKRYGTLEDRPVIVGAHWDVVPDSPGFDDNGSGTAVLLEVASTLSLARCFDPEYSIIFVALDQEEPGCYGSLEFIRSYLMPEFIENGIEIQGSIILDTIGNYDSSERSQDVPESWVQLAPKVVSRLASRNLKGDFLAVIGRRHTKETRLAKLIHDVFSILPDEGFKVEHFELDKLPHHRMANLEELFNHTYFWRSDNSRFWYYTDDKRFHSLGSVLLTDTAFHRGYMRHCYHKNCDSIFNPDLKRPESLKFATKIAQTLVLVLGQMTEGVTQCDLTALGLADIPVDGDQIQEADDPRPSASITKKEVEPELSEAIMTTWMNMLSKQITSAWPPFQPNFGNQFNIGQVTVNMATPAVSDKHDDAPADDENEEHFAVVLPGQEVEDGPAVETAIVDFLRRVASVAPETRNNQKMKIKQKKKTRGQRKNSPMLIKLFA